MFMCIECIVSSNYPSVSEQKEMLRQETRE